MRTPPSLPPGPRPNRLFGAASPYLRAHGHDPVDWFPWSDEAFERAKTLNKPVFLSIGYAACHWCHVMHRESFQDADTAALLNESCVSIKVDREEHPAVDRLYLEILLEMNGEAGWPASLFLLPDGRAFEGGTYHPPWPKYGMAAFRTVVQGAADRYRRLGDGVLRATRTEQRPIEDVELNDVLMSIVDGQHDDGGWGGEARFPHGPRLLLLADSALLHGDLAMRERCGRVLRQALKAMVGGGLQDHLGGGFHRYCVDGDWGVPHFEKMLYDNALLSTVLLRAWSAGIVDGSMAATAGRALEWMVTTLRRPDGAFNGSQDADDDSGEGHFYAWRPDELSAVLGPALGRTVAGAWGVGSSGPVDGGCVLRPRTPGARSLLVATRRRLLAHRAQRPCPPVHDQAVVAWNGLAVIAFAEAARLMGHPPYADVAAAVAETVCGRMVDGRLPRTLSRGAPDGVLEDHSAMLLGLLALHQCTGAARWMAGALELAAEVQHAFAEADGRLRQVRSAGLLPTVPIRAEDSAEPAGWGMALVALQQLEALGWADARPELWTPRPPQGAETHHRALLRHSRPHRSLVITGDPEDARTQALLKASHRPWRPDLVVLVVDPASPGALAALGCTDGRLYPGPPRAWRCTGSACALPTVDPEVVGDWVREG